MNLAKSITLIGPSCVGKSLVSKELSKRLNIPVINIDDLIDVIELELNGYLTPSPEQQKQYIASCLQDILNDDQLQETLLDDRYIETEKRLVKELVDMYNFYHNLLGDFGPFYNIISNHDQCLPYFENSSECIYSLNHLTNQMLEIIFKKINTPIIIDPPASYGWQASKTITERSSIRLKYSPLKLNISKTQNIMNSILHYSQTVLLLPGFDYNQRNAFRNVEANNFILNDLNNYFTTDLVVTTNGLFYDPENEYLQQRKWLDAREVIEKENLKNKCEVNNICDNIIIMLDELTQYSQNVDKSI